MVKSIKLVLLLLTLFSFVLGIEELIFDEKENKHESSGSKSFALKKNGDFNKKYLQVSIISKSQSKRNQYAIIANSTECYTGRKLVGMAPYGPVNLIIPKEYLSESLYLCVQCSEQSCNYEINLRAEDKAKFSIGEQYSYYIKDNKTTTMDFEFEVKNQQPPANLRKLSTVKTYHNIWVKAENLKDASIKNVPSGSNPYSFGHGKIFHIKYSNINSYHLNVQGNIGDYINIGSIEINDKVASPLKVNDQEILAVLTRDEESKEICFPTEKREDLTDDNDIFYINGIVFTKKLKTYYREKKDGDIDEYSYKNITESNIIEGIYYGDYKSEKVYCASFLEGDKKNFTIFSLQLSSNKYNFYSQFVYPPQYPGVIYPHFLLKNEMAIFRGMKPKQGANEINYNMKAIMGFPDMLFDNCTTYPNCSYNDQRLYTIKDPHHSNRMSVHSFYLKEAKEITPISTFQPLMIVKCREGPKYKNKSSEYCIFETSIFTNKDRLKLKEVETISQFLLKNESDLYTVDFDGEEGVEKIYLDLMVFSGDVKFKIDDTDQDVDKAAHKYFLANKIFYSIHVKDIKNKNKTHINFSVVAQKNSFYIISYQLVKPGENNLNIRESGTNFVESIAIEDEKVDSKLIYLQNFRSDVGTPFLASFYSKNCKFAVARSDDPNNQTFLERFGDFSQVIIKEDDKYYHADKYIFNVSILRDDVSYYNKKVCMVYVSGLELENKDTGGQRAISLSEGVPHSFLFSKEYYTMTYAYHLSDLNNTVIIDLNLIDKATFKVFLYFDYFIFNNYTIVRNQQIMIYPNELKRNCVEDEVCTINIVIHYDHNSNTNSKQLEKRVETTITQVKGAPIYLAKNVLKQDFLIGDKEKFYYTDIGRDEQGDITINYKRNSGNIYATIVNKTDFKEIKDADWRGIYKFPREIGNSLRYESYLKKIIIEPKHTEHCNDGCYLLITVKGANLRELNYTNEKETSIPYRFTIIPRIIQRDLTKFEEIPKVTIPMNEYIIGNVELVHDETLYYYYEVTLPFESESLVIDWQADKPTLLINVGKKNPSINQSDFIFNKTKHDTVFKITKNELLEKCNKKNEKLPIPGSIRYLTLSLAIYSKKVDSLYTSVYAFKLFMPPTYQTNNTYEKEAYEIIHIRSDQKVQCDPGDFKICLFAVIFEEGDLFNDLIVYPRAHNENAEITFFGDLVDSRQIERNNIPYLTKKIPTMQGKYHSGDNRKYIYIDKIPRNKTFLFCVSTDIPTIIEVLSSTSKDYFTVPNPSTPQIFKIPSDKKLYLHFQSSQDYLINIFCVSGEGSFHWEDEPNKKFHLLEYNDRLTLTSGAKKEENKFSRLIATSSEYNWYKNDNSGFVFYITYYPRSSEHNFDQVKEGRSTEFNYRDIRFPLNFFTPIKDKDISVSFNFYNFYSKEKKLPLKYNDKLFNISGKIITLDDAYYARVDPNYNPAQYGSVVPGVSDGPLGVLYLNKSSVENFKEEQNKEYALFFRIESTKLPSDLTGANLEVSVLREQTTSESKLFVPENVYINGKLSNNDHLGKTHFRHKLLVDKDNPLMLIEFSSNSENVKWAISKNANEEANSTSLTKVNEAYIDGKSKYLINITDIIDNNSIYLNVFYKANNSESKINPKLAHYVFKYMRGNNAGNLFDLKLKNRTVSHSKKDKTYTLQFEPALENKAEEEDVTYYIKGIYNESLVKGEKLDSIAISESPGINLKIHNATAKSGKIDIKLENVEKPLSCIKVLAKATSRAINEYMLYEVINFNKVENKTKPADTKNDTKHDNKTKDDNKTKHDNKTKDDNKTKHDNKTKDDNKTKHDNNTKDDNKTKHDNNTKVDNKTKPDNNAKQPNNTNTGKQNDKSVENKDKDKTILWVVLGIGGGLALIIIILLITVLVFNSKNKNLMDQVKNISFAGGEGRNNLLHDDDKNILK